MIIKNKKKYIIIKKYIIEELRDSLLLSYGVPFKSKWGFSTVLNYLISVYKKLLLFYYYLMGKLIIFNFLIFIAV